jgi:hypothetical protein
MLATPNALQWDGGPGHYEVYYLTLTDPRTGVGVWIRYTMLAPLEQAQAEATCALWFLAMDPREGEAPRFGRKLTLPIGQLRAQTEPFELRVGEALLRDDGMLGSLDDASWDLRWTPSERHYKHVHPVLRRAKVAQTVLVLPHADLTIAGRIAFGSTELEIEGARGGQAHLWGTKHARSWAWVHCNEFATLEAEPVPDTFVDAVSVFISRFGRDVGPNTPVVARIDGEDFCSTSPLRVLRNQSDFTLTGWRFEAIDGSRKLVCEVDADRELLAGVTYHDPDGERAYCYNGETASMRLHLYERSRGGGGGWRHRQTLQATGRAHFEYAQRTPIGGLELLTK